MKQKIIDSIKNTDKHTRRWMGIAFISGMIFTAVLAQTAAAPSVNTGRTGHEAETSGEHEVITPTPSPAEKYLRDKDRYGLAEESPKHWTAIYG